MFVLIFCVVAAFILNKKWENDNFDYSNYLSNDQNII